ncbi:MAG: PQQ-like beta-propeller repeat protein [Sedimentisphaerales bacterium]|nr:PQQ-like beta-propeller repeat protein [Sedimentisphaerales bacterium]
MVRIPLFSFLLFVGFFGSTIFCSGAEDVSAGLLVSRPILTHAGLIPDWQIKLPMRSGESTQRVFVFGDNVFVQTNMNHLFCLRRTDGAFQFGLPLALQGLPVPDPLYYEGKLWFIVGKELKILDPSEGQIVLRKILTSVGLAVVGPIARNTDFLYVPGADNRLHVYSIESHIQKFSTTADNDSQITSVIADDEFVVFATGAGNVVSILPDQNRKRWQYDVLGAITAPIVRDGNFVYVSSRDAKLYKLDMAGGQNVWPSAFHARDPLLQSAVVGQIAVYQSTVRQGIHAVDKETGRGLWTVSNGVGVITEKGDVAYVFASPGLLVAMDNSTGRRLQSVNAHDVTQYAVSMTEAKLFLGDNTGRIMCVTPVEAK